MTDTTKPALPKRGVVVMTIEEAQTRVGKPNYLVQFGDTLAVMGTNETVILRKSK